MPADTFRTDPVCLRAHRIHVANLPAHEDFLEEVADAISTEGRAKFNAQQKYDDLDIYKGHFTIHFIPFSQQICDFLTLFAIMQSQYLN